MLWYKGWLEVRIRLLMSIGIVCFGVNTAHSLPLVAGKVAPPAVGALLFGSTIAAALACLWLAGAGIVTQPVFQATKGIHGSTLYTLSLPVSRFRLLAVRASLGWLLMSGSIGVLCGGTWAASPAMRTMATTGEMFEHGTTLLACASAFYFFCVLLATFLEDQWRIVGAMASFIGLSWMSKRVKLPPFADLFWAMGKGSPLLTHSMPWSTISFSVVFSVALFLVALKIVQTREY